MVPKGFIVLLMLFGCQQTLAHIDCDRERTFDATFKGEIVSPDYESGSYESGLSCSFKITAPAGYRIKLTFEDLDINPSEGCLEDKLVIEGESEDSDLLGVFCGNLIPYPVLSHENEKEIRMTFKTVAAGGRGFKIQYESSPDMELCGDDEGICRNRNCYKVVDRCDGSDNCGDGTDEEECGKPIAEPSDEDCGDTPIQPNTIYSSHDRLVAAVPNSWPWQVSLQHMEIEPNGHFCGGTLISPQWVVSAAHCFAGFQHASQVRVVLGSHFKFNRTQFEVTRVAERIISYPDLENEELTDFEAKHDISLIKLNAPVFYSDGIQPVCLPYKGWETKPGWNCYSTGWGESDATGYFHELKQTLQVIQHKENCTHEEETQICVDKAYDSPCLGDSGGPLVCKLGGKWYVMGATSFNSSGNQMGKLCESDESKAIFAKIADKGEWIREVINTNA